MKLGVLTVPLQAMSTEDAFKYLHSLGVQTVELGTGGYTNGNHCNPDVLLADETKIDELKALLKTYDLEISALSCHGNPVHPDKAVAAEYHRVFVNTCKLAQKLGVDTIVTFSGCPGDSPDSHYPNWVTCAWPDDYPKILDYQWNEVLIPYWKEAAKIAESYGVQHIAFEMHPGFCVYNPATCLRLREAVGPILGANFDPSHLIWQGIDPVEALKALKGAVYHFSGGCGSHRHQPQRRHQRRAGYQKSGSGGGAQLGIPHHRLRQRYQALEGYDVHPPAHRL